MATPRRPTVTVYMRERTVVVHLDEPPANWHPLLDEIRGYARSAAVVELHGPGWDETFARSMERALKQALEPRGVTVVRGGPARV